MRFNDRITFVKKGESYYDPEKGEYVETDPIKTKLPCNLSTLGTDRTNELFGQMDKVITVARLQRPYNDEFDHALINNQKYQVKRQSNYRKGAFYLESAST